MRRGARYEARQAGLSRYFSDKPCPKGHIGERYVVGGCVICNLARSTASAKRNPEKVKENLRRYRETHREKCREDDRVRQRQRRAANPEKHRLEVKKWTAANPDKSRVIGRVKASARRALQRGNGGKFTTQDIERLRKIQKDCCAECKKRKRLTVDHIIPLSRGGTNDPRNLQLLCGSCNSQKSHKDPIAWAQENGRLL